MELSLLGSIQIHTGTHHASPVHGTTRLWLPSGILRGFGNFGGGNVTSKIAAIEGGSLLSDQSNHENVD